MMFPYFAGLLLAPTTAIRVSGPRRRRTSKTSGGCGSGRLIQDLLRRAAANLPHRGPELDAGFDR